MCGLIPTHYTCGHILVFPPWRWLHKWPKCRWLLYNKLKFIHSSSFVGLFKNFACQ